MIATDNGDKPIENICIGDYVLSKNELTGEISYRKVVSLFERKTDVFVRVVIGNEEIVTTPEHPFWIDEKGWVAAKDLCKGDRVSVQNNVTNIITSTVIQKCTEEISVYNFEVDGWHTYFVSKLHVLVHNKCNWNFASDSYLKRKGLDAHAIKYEYLGKNAKVSLYDLYYDKSTGAISIFLKKTKQLVEVTTYFIK